MIKGDQHLVNFNITLKCGEDFTKLMFQGRDLSKEMADDSIAKVVKPVVLVGCPVIKGEKVESNISSDKASNIVVSMMIYLERGCFAQWWMEWMFLQSQGLTCKARCIQYIPT